VTALRTRRLLAAILALALALFACGIWWGLPNQFSWAGDELHPSTWPQAISPDSIRGWHTRYPPLHFALLQGLSLPLRALIDHGVFKLDDLARVAWLIWFSRAVSLVMALGTVWLVYRVGREVYDERSALFAALLTVLVAPLVYYAKMGNLDAPYLFWFALSLLFYVRLLKEHRRRDYVLFAAAAAAAVCTKDQAYGLYLLAPIPILIGLGRHAYPERGRLAGIARALVDRRFLAAAATAVAGFAVFQELLTNPRRFALHVHLLLGPMSEDYQDYSGTPTGQWELLRHFLRQVVFVLNPALTAVCVAGLLWTAWRAFRYKDRGADDPEDTREILLLGAIFWLLVSYYLTFLDLILFSYDRYLLPVALLLALFGGRLLGALTRPGVRLPWLRWAAVAAGLVYSLLYAGSVDARLLADSRYHVEDWLHRHAAPTDDVAAIGRRHHIPRFRWLPWAKVVRGDGRLIAEERPDFLTVTVSDLRHPEEIDIYQRLASGELGYRLVLLYEGKPLFDLLDLDDAGSSQRFVNPEMAVFKRLPEAPTPGAPGGGVSSGPPPVSDSSDGAE